MAMSDLDEIKLFNNLRRKLRRSTGEALHRCRESSPNFYDLGKFYITDQRGNLWEKDVDLSELRKRLSAGD